MDEPELKIIDVFICKLRKKLAAATNGDNYIETVWAAAMCCAIRRRKLRRNGFTGAVNKGRRHRRPFRFLRQFAVQNFVVERRAYKKMAVRHGATLAAPISLPMFA